MNAAFGGAGVQGWPFPALFQSACSKASASDGFAAVDALVALTILAVTISLSLQAAAHARRAALTANEIQRADDLLRYLLETRPKGGETGQSEGFVWRVEIAAVGDLREGRAYQLCRRAAEARSRQSDRWYSLATVEPCPARLTS